MVKLRCVQKPQLSSREAEADADPVVPSGNEEFCKKEQQAISESNIEFQESTEGAGAGVFPTKRCFFLCLLPLM